MGMDMRLCIIKGLLLNLVRTFSWPAEPLPSPLPCLSRTTLYLLPLIPTAGQLLLSEVVSLHSLNTPGVCNKHQTLRQSLGFREKPDSVHPQGVESQRPSTQVQPRRDLMNGWGRGRFTLGFTLSVDTGCTWHRFPFHTVLSFLWLRNSQWLINSTCYCLAVPIGRESGHSFTESESSAWGLTEQFGPG